MEDQNDLARSAARAFKANVVTGGKGDKAELAAQPLLCTGRRNTWKRFSSDNSESCPVLADGTTGTPQGLPRRDARRIKVPMLKEIGGAVAFDASEVTAWLCVPPDPRNAELTSI